MKHAGADVAAAPLAVGGRSPDASRDYVALTKPRLNLLVVATSAAGYYLGGAGLAGSAADGARPSPARRWWPAARPC